MRLFVIILPMFSLILGVLVLSTVVVLFTIIVVSFIFVIIIGAPFLPTDRKIVGTMLDLVRLQSGERFIDLGSGDGRLVIAAAERGANAVGIEVNPLLVIWSRIRIARRGLGSRAKIRWGSFWSTKFSATDVISVFGITEIMPRLERKCKEELPSGARVVSYIFKFPTWEPTFQRGGVRVYQKNPST